MYAVICRVIYQAQPYQNIHLILKHRSQKRKKKQAADQIFKLIQAKLTSPALLWLCVREKKIIRSSSESESR